MVIKLFPLILLNGLTLVSGANFADPKSQPALAETIWSEGFGQSKLHATAARGRFVEGAESIHIAMRLHADVSRRTVWEEIRQGNLEGDGVNDHGDLNEARHGELSANNYIGEYIVSVNLKEDDKEAAESNSKIIYEAMKFVYSRGGGVVQLSCGRIYIGETVDNIYSRVLVKGCGSDVFHDAGAPTYGTILLPTFAGTVLRHRSVSGASHARNTGGGFVDITVDGNGIATRLLHVTSIASGEYHLYLRNSVGHEAALFDSLETGKNLAEAADTQFSDISLFIRQIDGEMARNANGVVFGGSGNANFSANKNVNIQIQHYNGDAVICENADNNTISIGAFRAGGSGRTLTGYGISPGTGCYSNIFSAISGKGQIYMRGTNDGDSAGVSNQIAWLDTANGTPAPTAGTASSWTWTESNSGVSVGLKGAHVIFGANAGEVSNAQITKGASTTLDVINDSQDGVRIRTSDNSVSWGLAPVGQNLRVLQLAGENGSLETKQIKLHSQNVTSLPKCNDEYAGSLASVYDAKEIIFNSVLVGGGSFHSLAYCDGENWRMH